MSLAALEGRGRFPLVDMSFFISCWPFAYRKAYGGLFLFPYGLTLFCETHFDLQLWLRGRGSKPDKHALRHRWNFCLSLPELAGSFTTNAWVIRELFEDSHTICEMSMIPAETKSFRREGL